jgi:hypothetical protein
MGNCKCNKCDLGFYETLNEMNQLSSSSQNICEKTNIENENNRLNVVIKKYEKFLPEIIFLQLKIRKLLLGKKMNQKYYFYNKIYNNQSISINDNNNNFIEEQDLNTKENTINYNQTINFPKHYNSDRYKSYSQKYNSLVGEDSTNSGNLYNNDNKVYKVDNYIINSNIIYTGNMLNGKQHGYGVQKWADGAKYEGKWENGKTCGYGVFYHSDGDIYKGYWKDDKANGRGIYTSIDGVKYEGQWKNDTQDGYGIETWNDGCEYRGNYKEGKKMGRGEYSWPDGSKFIGNWNNNLQDGYGIYIWPDNKKYEGNFKNNTLHGNGHYSWPDGREYYGMFIMGKREGIGKYYWNDGRIFIGFWENGKQHGLGMYINKEKKEMWGIWINGRRNRWLSDEQIQMLKEENDEFIQQIENFDEEKYKYNDTQL